MDRRIRRRREQRSGSLGLWSAQPGFDRQQGRPDPFGNSDPHGHGRLLDHRQRDPCRRLRARRSARLQRLWTWRRRLRQRCQVRSGGAGQRQRHLLPGGLCTGNRGAVSLDRRIRRRREQRSGGLGCGAANQASTVSKATPTLVGTATSPVKAGLTITDSVTLAGGFDGGRTARLPRLRTRRSELRQRCRLRSDGSSQRQRHLLPGGLCTGSGAVSVDRRIRGRRATTKRLPWAVGRPTRARPSTRPRRPFRGRRPPPPNPASRSPTA